MGEQIADTAAVALRMADIEPFHVMALLAHARELEAQGKSVIHMEIGEPDFITPAPIIEAGIRALKEGRTHYTPAVGILQLRETIAGYYRSRYDIDVAPQRIVITPGASGALQLLMGILINPGDEVLMADPGYPCNRHFVRLFEGQAIGVPVDAANSYQLTPELVAKYCSVGTRAVLLASPSNPTGALVPEDHLREIGGLCQSRGIRLIVDEIYHGLVYDEKEISALGCIEDVFVVNSFSKYFGMTGWRVGWLVAPEVYIPHIDKMAQNIFLAPSTLAQHAALAAFNSDTLEILDLRRDEFRRRRNFLLPVLQELGFSIPCTPQGAFYLYAGCRNFTDDSYTLAMQLLDEAGVAITPGRDFGHHDAEGHVRFAYTTSLPNLKEGVERLRKYL